MAYESIGYTPGSGKDIAGDTIANRTFQRVKFAVGDEGAAVDVSASNPMPVTVGNFPATQPVSLASQPLPTGAATEATLASALAALVAIAGDTDTAENLLRELVRAATSPAGFDRAQGRNRVTAVVESGTVTTVSTVTTVTTVTTVSGLTNIDGRNGAMLINQTNLSAWADCHRARIT